MINEKQGGLPHCAPPTGYWIAWSGVGIVLLLGSLGTFLSATHSPASQSRREVDDLSSSGHLIALRIYSRSAIPLGGDGPIARVVGKGGWTKLDFEKLNVLLLQSRMNSAILRKAARDHGGASLPTQDTLAGKLDAMARAMDVGDVEGAWRVHDELCSASPK
jgi:hypothetical protein